MQLSLHYNRTAGEETAIHELFKPRHGLQNRFAPPLSDDITPDVPPNAAQARLAALLQGI